MAQNATIKTGIQTGRVRVRTPGKYVVLFLFAPVILVALGAGLWLNTVSHHSASAALEYRKTSNGEKAAYFALPIFLVDLSPDANGRTAYLKMRASISLGEKDAAGAAVQLEAVRPAMTERLTFFLRELTPEDFDGSEGMARVKREMLRRVNLLIAPASANDVIIEELVIQ